jgi:hypothetical protein
MLARKPEILEKALLDLDLLDRVATHKGIFYKNSYSRYDEAKIGTLHFMPPDYRIPFLADDYRAMQDMFFDKASIIPFDQILQEIAELEKRINAISQRN